MSGFSGADDVIVRCGCCPAAVTGRRVLHSFYMFEYGFDSPETAAGKYGDAFRVGASVLVDDRWGNRCGCRGITAGGEQNQTRDQQSFAHSLLLQAVLYHSRSAAGLSRGSKQFVGSLQDNAAQANRIVFLL